jgi:hypothetical protein
MQQQQQKQQQMTETDYFFAQMPQKKGDKAQIGRWYVRNDLQPTVIAEVDFCQKPKIVYSKLVREQNKRQRVFILGGTSERSISD